jgi:PAS domain S-box-containing protein
MATIQLLIRDERNRELLADALEDSHTIADHPDSEQSFLDAEIDLVLVDAGTFRSQRDRLEAKRVDTEPVFLPYLLFLGDDDPDQASEAVWDLVDEVIATPIDRTELRNRLSNLLRRRELSLGLKRRQEFTEERFRTLFESTPDPIVVVGADGVVNEVNDAFVSLFDRPRDAVVGTHVADTDLATNVSIERLLLRVADPDGAAVDETVEILAGDGDNHVTEVNVDVVEELGEAAERIGIFRDVTGREAYKDKLERQVERFASVISHDLRDPLNLARAKVKLAKQESDSEKLDELSAIHDRMGRLIEAVLTLAKQGQVVGETEPVDLEEVVTAAWETGDSPEQARLEVVDDLGILSADPERLQALLENLFRNAVRHAGPGVRIEVGSLGETPGFYVADDGAGIPADERDAVFEYGHSTDENGTGLGLAIVDRIADAHDWSVTVHESEAGGSRFEISVD